MTRTKHADCVIVVHGLNTPSYLKKNILKVKDKDLMNMFTCNGQTKPKEEFVLYRSGFQCIETNLRAVHNVVVF